MDGSTPPSRKDRRLRNRQGNGGNISRDSAKGQRPSGSRAQLQAEDENSPPDHHKSHCRAFLPAPYRTRDDRFLVIYRSKTFNIQGFRTVGWVFSEECWWCESGKRQIQRLHCAGGYTEAVESGGPAAGGERGKGKYRPHGESG